MKAEFFISKYPTLNLMAAHAEEYNRTLRTLLAADNLIRGDKEGYAAIISGQAPCDKLGLGDYLGLSGFFYLSRIRPSLRKVLETYIVMDGYSRTNSAKRQITNLPKEQRNPASHTEMISTIVDRVSLPEIVRLSIAESRCLKDALIYRGYLDQPRLLNSSYQTFSEEARHIVLGTAISQIAVGDGDYNLEGCPRLTSSVTANIIQCLNERFQRDSARELYLKSIPD